MMVVEPSGFFVTVPLTSLLTVLPSLSVVVRSASKDLLPSGLLVTEPDVDVVIVFPSGVVRALVPENVEPVSVLAVEPSRVTVLVLPFSSVVVAVPLMSLPPWSLGFHSALCVVSVECGLPPGPVTVRSVVPVKVPEPSPVLVTWPVVVEVDSNDRGGAARPQPRSSAELGGGGGAEGCVAGGGASPA